MSIVASSLRAVGAHRLLAALGLAVMALAAVAPTAALAHERRSVAGYDLVVGWFVEPALEGEKNGLDLRITKAGANIEGAEKTLKFDVTHVQSKATKSYPIRAVFGAPGRYTADVIPTLTGQYKIRIYGDIQGTKIDETFTSGPGTYGNIEPVKDLMFPVAASQPREIEGAVRGASDDAAAAVAAAKSARTFGIAGIALGALGLAAGAGALVTARGKRA